MSPRKLSQEKRTKLDELPKKPSPERNANPSRPPGHYLRCGRRFYFVPEQGISNRERA